MSFMSEVLNCQVIIFSRLLIQVPLQPPKEHKDVSHCRGGQDETTMVDNQLNLPGFNC